MLNLSSVNRKTMLIAKTHFEFLPVVYSKGELDQAKVLAIEWVGSVRPFHLVVKM